MSSWTWFWSESNGGYVPLLRISFIAVTPLMKFKDDVYVQAVPVDGDPARSSVAVYSASRIGYSDMGTNAKRVKELLELIGSR